jgi:hypothetical protein
MRSENILNLLLVCEEVLRSPESDEGLVRVILKKLYPTLRIGGDEIVEIIYLTMREVRPQSGLSERDIEKICDVEVMGS